MGVVQNMVRICLVLLSLVWIAAVAKAQNVGLIKIDGAIGPATANYITRAVDQAAASGYQCIVIQLDTPGGLLDSTKEIVQKLFSDSVPTVVYVAPSGASAASAGTFITLAANVAVMAPNTSIGAAHPVSLTGQGTEEKPDNTMKQKLENYASSWMENIATRRHRNIDWARSSVRESASITSEEALKLDVIDFIAKDRSDLLAKLDGRKVGDRVLHTANAAVVEIPMVAHERVFQLLWRPEVMFLLMLIAIYGIIGEISNPGAIIPGVVGAIALILVLYMGAILPVNIAGVALILLALALFVIDVFAPSHGVLSVGAVISFFLGSMMLFNRTPGFGLSLAFVIPATIVTALFFLFIVGAGLRAQVLPVKTGREGMIGQTVTTLSPVDQNGGRALAEGENWSAVSQTPIPQGEQAEIVEIKGLTLHLKPKP